MIESPSGPAGPIAVLVALGVLVSVAPAPVASLGTAHPDPSFDVGLQADGSATVSVTYTFDLTSDAERAAFKALQRDETKRTDLLAGFRHRMAPVATAAANATGREMAITDGSIALATTADDRTGVVRLAVEWAGLADQDGDRLVLTEPFASEFTPDRRFVVRPPDGYAITGASPAPAARERTRVTWTPGTDLDGFEVVAAPGEASTAAEGSTPRSSRTATPSASTTTAGTAGHGATEPEQHPPHTGRSAVGGPGYGFGHALAAFAVLAAGLIANRYWREP